MLIDHLETGSKVLVLTEYSDKYLLGTISENEYIKNKYVDLHNGEEVFSFEIKDYILL